MKKGQQVKITKISDEVFEGKHPNNINLGYEKVGILHNNIEIGYSIQVGSLVTSCVTEIIDENTYRTNNSIYKVVPYDKDYNVEVKFYKIKE